MQLSDHGGPGSAPSRQRQPRETEAEHTFWCRYWEVLRSQGLPAGREIWYERACARFIRELKPRRLREGRPEEVTQYMAFLAQQPDSAGWKIRQADDALRILYQELVHLPWAAKWPVGLPELDGWMEGPEGGGKMPVPADAAQARFSEQVNRMIRVIRCLHYSYRTEEAGKLSPEAALDSQPVCPCCGRPMLRLGSLPPLPASCRPTRPRAP